MFCWQVYSLRCPPFDKHAYSFPADVVFRETEAKFVDLQLQYTALRPAVRVECMFRFRYR